MRAKYASAIRKGILMGRQTRYGDVDDPYYELRSKIIWGWSDSRLRDLALEAFKHAWKAQNTLLMAGKTEEELSEAERNFGIAWERWTESREERQLRLLREEVQDLKQKLKRIESDE